jgi:hypothetical protein
MKSPRYQPRSRKCLAWITSLLALTVIVLQVMQHDAVASASLKWSQLLPRYGWPLALATALLPLNWGIEALKWHLLLRRSRRSMNQSYREVLVGSTWGFLTPNRSGDAVARVALLPAEQRSLGLRSFGWSAWAQGGMTLTFGSLATAWFMSPLAAAAGTKVLWLIPMLALAGAAAWWTLGRANIRFGFNALMWLQQRFKLPTWLDPETIESDQARPHFPLIIALSAARYSVFTCQFALGLIAYGFGDVTVLIPAIAMVYWGNMIIPTACSCRNGGARGVDRHGASTGARDGCASHGRDIFHLVLEPRRAGRFRRNRWTENNDDSS